MDDLVAQFNKFYYKANSTWTNLKFMGHTILKCPMDLFIYQEIFYEVHPDVVIECGTFNGGSAWFWASLFKLNEIPGLVLSIDIDPKSTPHHPLIKYIKGDSCSPEVLMRVESILMEVRENLGRDPIVLVNLDASHLYEHVCKELEVYSKYVAVGSYLIVEDSNLDHDQLQLWDMKVFGKGPWHAIHDFIETHPDFQIDKSREKLYVTFNPDGYIRRVR